MSWIIPATTAAARSSRRALISVIVGTAAACGGSPTTPPPVIQPTLLQVSCPAPIERESVSGDPLTLTFDPPVASGGTAPVVVTCQPASGSEFPVGSTSVSCQARDAGQQLASCNFSVSVRGTPRLAVTSFLAFGDSLTAGVTAPSLFVQLLVEPNSYPFKLERMLADRYRAQTVTVINDGVPGEEAYDAEQRRFASALRVHRPEVMLLMQGTNDLFFWREAAFDRALPALESMVQQGHGAGARMFLATIPPQRPGGSRDAVSKLIPAFNTQIRAIASRTQARLVDIEAAILEDLSLIGNDDLHLTERGYEKVAATFFLAIQNTLEVAPPAPAIR